MRAVMASSSASTRTQRRTLATCLQTHDEIEGYNVDDYFRDGIYLGQDQHGIEPTFVDAFAIGGRVQGGEGEDFDTGTLESIEGDMGFVRWDSGVSTRAPLANLEVAA